MRDLVGTVQREKAQAGYYHSPGFGRDYPLIQSLTIRELMEGTAVDAPSSNVTFKQAGKVKGDGPEQLSLLK